MTPTERRRAWRKANPERKRATDRAWYAANRERAAAVAKAWVRANKDKVRASKRAWAEANREYEKAYRSANRARIRQTIKAWSQANKLRVNEYSRRRSARERRAAIGEIDYAKALRDSNGLCGICRKPLDLFGIHFDHIVPLARGGAHTQDNIQATHAYCNLAKGARAA